MDQMRPCTTDNQDTNSMVPNESMTRESGEPVIVALDGFALETRTKAVLILIAPVLEPSNYQVMPKTDMLEGKGGIAFKETTISSTADSQLSKALKNDRLDA